MNRCRWAKEAFRWLCLLSCISERWPRVDLTISNHEIQLSGPPRMILAFVVFAIEDTVVGYGGEYCRIVTGDDIGQVTIYELKTQRLRQPGSITVRLKTSPFGYSSV